MTQQKNKLFGHFRGYEAAVRTGTECQGWGIYLSVELLSNTELGNAAGQQVVHRPGSVATAADWDGSSFRELKSVWGGNIGCMLLRKAAVLWQLCVPCALPRDSVWTLAIPASWQALENG